MGVRLFPSALLAIAVCLLASGFGSRADASVLSASAFHDSVGVDTHLTNANTAYGDWPRLVGALDELGVKHVSDAVFGNPAPSWGWFNDYFQKAVELAVSHGIHFAFAMGRPNWGAGTIDQLVSVLSGPLRNAVEAVEEPNEYDTSSGLSDWASQLAAYDRQLYAAVKASPSLRSLPVIGPSLVGHDAPTQLGDQQSSLDVGAIHPYMGGQSPGPSYTAAELQRISAVSGQKPVWATELGYYNALNAPRGTLQPVSEAAGAVYLLREFLENFKSGIARTYAYELIDDNPNPTGVDVQQHFGLLRNDYTPKPAFTALKNLLSLVGQQAPATLTPLRLSTTSAPGDLRQLVLQQADHTYLVILWRLASVWDTNRRQALSVPATQLNLNLPDATSAAIADPITTNTLTPLTLSGAQAHIDLAADPIIIQVKTQPTTAPGQSLVLSPSDTAALVTSGSFPVVAPNDSLAFVAPSGSLTVISSSKAGAASPKPARPNSRQGRRYVTSARCHASPRLPGRVTPLLRPTLYWLNALLRTPRCMRDAAMTEISLYAAGRVHPRRGRSQPPSWPIVARRRLSSHNAQTVAHWIVTRARAEARRGHLLLVRSSPALKGH